MAKTIEIKVPDIGGLDDVPVIEVLVAEGDTVRKDQGLVTLESDKATMEVPAAEAGEPDPNTNTDLGGNRASGNAATASNPPSASCQALGR